MEQIGCVPVTRAAGVTGDFRGALSAKKPGARRQVSVLEAESWATAMAELGADEPWWRRRANLLVRGVRLPRSEGARIRIGTTCLLEVTMECDPCSRMEQVAPGLWNALTPDWRGGVLARVIEDGNIVVGDEVRVEP